MTILWDLYSKFDKLDNSQYEQQECVHKVYHKNQNIEF